MRSKLVEYKLNDRWSISSDKWNWILLDYQHPKKPHMSFYANLRQLSNALLDLKAKDNLTRLSAAKSKNTPTTGLNLPLMDKITQDLELFIKGLSNNEKTKYKRPTNFDGSEGRIPNKW